MPVVRETKTGTLETFYDDDSGRIREDGTDQPHDFIHPGARISFVVGDKVTYLKITLPNGNVLVNDIKKGAGS